LVPDNNGGNITVADTFDTYHTYTIDWSPDEIVWSVDGNPGRTTKKSDTWNATANRFDYPQTPSRVQLSLWPGGLSTNAEGTIAWAGGAIDWSSELMQPQGYYYASVKEVSVECYDPPSSVKKTGSVSYVIDDQSGDNSSVTITGKDTVLKSFLGSGTDMDAAAPSSASASSGAAASTEPATVPGHTGEGDGGNNHSGSDGDTVASSVASSGGSSSTGSASNPDSTGFSQGGSTSSTTKSGAEPHGEKALHGSIFAGLVAVVGTLML
jgi:beta-glucanase (GH16 family)